MSKQDLARAYKAKNWAEAVAVGEKLAAAAPLPHWAAVYLALAYYHLQNWSKASQWLERIIPSETKYKGEMYRFLGIAQRRQNNHVDAYRALLLSERTLRREGGANDAFLADILAMRGNSAMHLGKVGAAQRCFRRASSYAPDFKDKCAMFSSYLMSINSLDLPDDKFFANHLDFNRLFFRTRAFQYWHGSHGSDRIKIGYISPDFRRHVMFSFILPLFAGHDRRRFSLYGYYLGKTYDERTVELRSACDVWRELGNLDPLQAAEQIHNDGIDILVDLAGHSSGNGLPIMAYRPAPVQVSALGYMSTTGLRSVDFIMGDNYVDPPEFNGAFLSETPRRLTSLFCYYPPSVILASHGAPARDTGKICFACFNQYHKITDHILVLWRQILQQVPSSRLWLKNSSFADPQIRQQAERRFARLGLPVSRIIFDAEDRDYIKKYLAADIALDTYPYTGGGTTCDALYMGVPVVSLYGSRRGSRFGLSILNNAGIGDLAVSSPAAYVRLAVSLATDMPLLDALHRNLRPIMRRSPLTDTQGYIRQWEDFFSEQRAVGCSLI